MTPPRVPTTGTPVPDRLRVLLVEDDHVDQLAFQRYIREHSLPYDCSVAGSVTEAREALRSREFDVFVTDFALGDGTAFDIVEAAGVTPGIVVTGAGDEATAARVMRSGAYDYIIKDPARDYLRVLAISIDAAVRRHASERRISMLSHAMLSMSDSVYITGPDGTVVYVNRAFCESHGFAELEILGQSPDMLFRDAEVLADMRRYVEAGRDWTGEAVHVRPDGRELQVLLSVSPVDSTRHEPLAVVAVARDITERRRSEDALRCANLELERNRAYLERLATRDELTGLYNRRELMRLLHDEVERAQRYNRPAALMMLDLDHFKRINDTYGHPAGDEVLRRVGQCLLAEVRQVDRAARYGGEELAIILPETPAADAMLVAERIRRAIAALVIEVPAPAGGIERVRVTASVGVASVHADCTVDSLLRAADHALYAAKRGGRDRVVLYGSDATAVLRCG
jgi:diguanylate cyclase (GGDEF)-like protein/PAS domain S-box-containing protein